MRDRHRHMIARVEALDLEWSRSVENRRKLHAGFFLAKVYKAGPIAFDATVQSGYHFKWCAGPSSESLRDSFIEAADHRRFEKPDISGYSLEAYEVVRDVIHNGPCEECVENGLWARMLSMIAYLDSGSWSREGQREEVEDALGSELLLQHFDDGYKTLCENDMASLFNSEQQKERIFRQMERVRQSGEKNALDAHGVQRVAHKMDLHALVAFLGECPEKGYGTLIDEFAYWRSEEDLDKEHDYVERVLNL